MAAPDPELDLNLEDLTDPVDIVRSEATLRYKAEAEKLQKIIDAAEQKKKEAAVAAQRARAQQQLRLARARMQQAAKQLQEQGSRAVRASARAATAPPPAALLPNHTGDLTETRGIPAMTSDPARDFFGDDLEIQAALRERATQPFKGSRPGEAVAAPASVAGAEGEALPFVTREMAQAPVEGFLGPMGIPDVAGGPEEAPPLEETPLSAWQELAQKPLEELSRIASRAWATMTPQERKDIGALLRLKMAERGPVEPVKYPRLAEAYAKTYDVGYAPPSLLPPAPGQAAMRRSPIGGEVALPFVGEDAWPHRMTPMGGEAGALAAKVRGAKMLEGELLSGNVRDLAAHYGVAEEKIIEWRAQARRNQAQEAKVRGLAAEIEQVPEGERPAAGPRATFTAAAFPQPAPPAPSKPALSPIDREAKVIEREIAQVDTMAQRVLGPSGQMMYNQRLKALGEKKDRFTAQLLGEISKATNADAAEAIGNHAIQKYAGVIGMDKAKDILAEAQIRAKALRSHDVLTEQLPQFMEALAKAQTAEDVAMTLQAFPVVRELSKSAGPAATARLAQINATLRGKTAATEAEAKATKRRAQESVTRALAEIGKAKTLEELDAKHLDAVEAVGSNLEIGTQGLSAVDAAYQRKLGTLRKASGLEALEAASAAHEKQRATDDAQWAKDVATEERRLIARRDAIGKMPQELPGAQTIKEQAGDRFLKDIQAVLGEKAPTTFDELGDAVLADAAAMRVPKPKTPIPPSLGEARLVPILRRVGLTPNGAKQFVRALTSPDAQRRQFAFEELGKILKSGKMSETTGMFAAKLVEESDNELYKRWYGWRPTPYSPAPARAMGPEPPPSAIEEPTTYPPLAGGAPGGLRVPGSVDFGQPRQKRIVEPTGKPDAAVLEKYRLVARSNSLLAEKARLKLMAWGEKW